MRPAEVRSTRALRNPSRMMPSSRPWARRSLSHRRTPRALSQRTNAHSTQAGSERFGIRGGTGTVAPALDCSGASSLASRLRVSARSRGAVDHPDHGLAHTIASFEVGDDELVRNEVLEEWNHFTAARRSSVATRADKTKSRRAPRGRSRLVGPILRNQERWGG